MSKEREIIHVPRLGGAGLAQPGRTFRVIVSSSETGGKFALVEVHWKKGNASPLFAHTREDTHYYIAQGKFLISNGNETFDVRAGAHLLIPQNSPIAVRCVEDGVAIVTYVPGGLEKLHEDMAMLDLDELGDAIYERSKAYGVKILKMSEEVFRDA